MLATDPLSLIFLGCVSFSGAFLVISLVSGVGHGHVAHLGHGGHVAHVGHAGGASHTGTTSPGTQGGHGLSHTHASAHAVSSAPAGASSATAALWSSVSSALMGSLNVFGLLTFLFAFGLVGYLVHNATNAGVVLTLLLPALVGAAGAVGASLVLTRLFAVETGELTAEGSRLEGRLGKVSLSIRAGGVGEVIFARTGGGRQSIGARSADGAPISANTEVVIVSVEDGIANVQTWEAFMRDARAGHAPQLGAIEPGP